MKKLFNAILVMFILVLTFSNFAISQDEEKKQQDSKLIREAALNYIEGYYSGDAARMEKAIHPDINKASVREIPLTGHTALNYTTFSILMEMTKAKAGFLPDSNRYIDVKIITNDNNFSNVKVFSANFTDYLQLIKLENDWKIINVLFTSGSKVPPRIKGFNPDNEKPLIEKCLLNYMNGITGADAKRLEISADAEYNKISLVPVGKEGKQGVRRQRYSNLIEAAFAGQGKQDEIYRDNSLEILDVFDGLAIAKCQTVSFIEYVQLYKTGSDWKILNCITKIRTDLTLEKALAVTLGNAMPDFSLPVFGGGNFKLSDFKGKNVLLMFPRGKTPNGWCAYCPYQYLELEKLEKDLRIRKKYDLEIAFVMPYPEKMIKDWIEKFPDALKTVENIKNPAQPAPEGTIQADYAKWVKNNFPIKFETNKNDSHNTIPVLIDENKSLSRQLKIYTNFWDGVTSPQNMASVLIIDKKGILRLKYIGQMTEDRPSVDYLIDFIKNMK